MTDSNTTVTRSVPVQAEKKGSHKVYRDVARTGDQHDGVGEGVNDSTIEADNVRMTARRGLVQTDACNQERKRDKALENDST